MTSRTHRIAYLIDDLSYGGAQKQLTMLARALPLPFVPVVVALSEHTEPFAGILRDSDVEVFELPRSSRSKARRLAELTRTLASAGADAVHGFLDAANAYAYLSARTLRKPVVLSVQSDRLLLSAAKAAALSWMLRRSDRVTVNSVSGEKFLVEKIRVPRGRVVLIRNWIDLGEIGAPREAPGPREPKVVGNIGRLTEEKRIHLLVEAFAELLSEMPDAKLVLMGDGSERNRVIRRIEDLGISAAVQVVAPQPDVVDTLRRFHCFVMPSALEGLPNAAIEALSVGVPLIASPVGDLADLIIEGKTGELIPSDDPKDIARAMFRALNDNRLMQNARVEGPRLVAARFSMATALGKLIPLYEKLLGLPAQ